MRVAEFVLANAILLYGAALIVVAAPSALTATSPLTSVPTTTTRNYAFPSSPGTMRFDRSYSVGSPLKTANLSYGWNAAQQRKVANVGSTALQSSKRSDSSDLSGLAEELVNRAEKRAEGVDDLNVSNPGIEDVHRGVLLLLLRKMQGWLDGGAKNLDAIKTYLGFPRATVNLIDVAMTKLHSLYRKGMIDITKLLVAFYYSCDIEHMRGGYDRSDSAAAADDDAATVTKNFQFFLSDFGYTDADIRRVNEAQLTVELTKIVNGVRVPVMAAYSVTIDLMKNRMFDERSTDVRSVRKLAERYADDVRSREKVTDPIEVTNDHLQVLGKLIPDVFGLAYNHLELFAKLKKHDLDEQTDQEAVRNFSGFLKSFMDVFMIRYLEFKNKYDNVDAEFIEAIYPLIDFIDPDHAPENPKYSILNHRDHDGEEYEMHMRKLMDNALEKLLAVFGDENVETWQKNRTLKIDYPEGNLSKEKLVELMNSNTNDAFEVLSSFVSNFAQGIKDYDRYLFDRKNWPMEDELRPIDFILM